MDNLYKRHKDRLDKFSIPLKLRGNNGKFYNTTLYSEMGVYEICRWSQKEKANEFMGLRTATINMKRIRR